MKKSELLKIELEKAIAADDARCKAMVHYEGHTAEDHDKDWKAYYEPEGRLALRNIDSLKQRIRAEQNREAAVGDGVTIHLYSDAHAATVIKRTATTITVQHDIAIKDPNFKPEFIPGGFCAHCANQDDQTYTYERNPEGRIEKFHWSEKKGRFQGGGDGSIVLSLGRREYYDYNF